MPLAPDGFYQAQVQVDLYVIHISNLILNLRAIQESSVACSHQVLVTSFSDHLAKEEEEAQPGQIKGQGG